MIVLYVLGYLLVGLLVSFVVGKITKIKDDSKEIKEFNCFCLGAAFFFWPSALVIFLLFLPGFLTYKLITWGKK